MSTIRSVRLYFFILYRSLYSLWVHTKYIERNS